VFRVVLYIRTCACCDVADLTLTYDADVDVRLSVTTVKSAINMLQYRIDGGGGGTPLGIRESHNTYFMYAIAYMKYVDYRTLSVYCLS